jgi:digeranylgeranylglycerophospholipid reductase
MIKTDVLVIGSGPAGSSAAKHAALGGADVIIIDKKSEIGAPKRCAEGVSKKGLVDLEIKPNKQWVAKELDGVRLVSPNGTNVWLTSDEIELPEAGFILERKVFDKYMAMDAARAGAEIKIKTLARRMRKEGNKYVVTCEHMGEMFEIKANIIIAADGPESRVARWAGLHTATKAINMESGIQFEMVGVEMEKQDVSEFYFGSVAPGGYAWIFPKGDDIANVGLAVITNDTNKTPYQHLKEFIANCPATQNAQAVELNIGGDPVGGMPKKIYDDNIMVCGDAAGQIIPLTGGGIITGMKGGMYAGIAANNAIAAECFSEKQLKTYDQSVRDDIGHEIDKYLKVKNFTLSLSDKEFDSIADAFQNIQFKEVSTTELVKNLVKVNPKALLKLGNLI